LHNQWYYICNDHSIPGSTPYFRNSVISYVHYRNNGEIEPVYLNKIGVGRYDASASPVQAENYFRATGAEKSECPTGGFEIRNLKEGSYLVYPKIFNVKANATLILTASSANSDGGSIEIRANGIDGALLGICKISDTGGWDKYKQFKCELKNKEENIDLYFVFKGKPEEFVRLDQFSFVW